MTGDQFRLYELIWMRTIASQMKDAEGLSITVKINAQPADGELCTLSPPVGRSPSMVS